MNRAILFLLLSYSAGSLFATNITICSTGFGTASTSGCGSSINSPAANNLLPDGNWYVSGNSSGTFQSQAYVTINNASPVQGSGPWLSDHVNDGNGHGSGSSWLTSSNNQAANYINGTTTYYSTQFSLTGLQASTTQILGYWLADDYGSGIFLNGVAVNQSSLPIFGSVGGPMAAFTVDSTNATFLAGNNTLTFGFVNDATSHGTINNPANTPTGARVEFTSATAAAIGAVPEPGSLSLMIVGLIGVLMTRGAVGKHPQASNV